MVGEIESFRKKIFLWQIQRGKTKICKPEERKSKKDRYFSFFSIFFSLSRDQSKFFFLDSPPLCDSRLKNYHNNKMSSFAFCFVVHSIDEEKNIWFSHFFENFSNATSAPPPPSYPATASSPNYSHSHSSQNQQENDEISISSASSFNRKRAQKQQHLNNNRIQLLPLFLHPRLLLHLHQILLTTMQSCQTTTSQQHKHLLFPTAPTPQRQLPHNHPSNSPKKL